MAYDYGSADNHLLRLLILPPRSSKQGKVIGVGVHIYKYVYIYVCGQKKI